MYGETLNFDKNEIKALLDESYISFFKNLTNKQNAIEIELRQIQEKKEQIISKISENKEIVDKDPKESREYISNSESVLESIELVYRNLSQLQSFYRDIEKNLIIINEKIESNYDNSNYKQEIYSLVESINEVKEFEKKSKEDNEKNYIIIDSFWDKQIEKSEIIEKNIGFERLTLENLKDKPILKICEKRVELPYTKKEVENFMKTYPNEYKTVQDVIAKEFMVNIAIFNKHPILSRFKEAYYLCRTKEMLPIFDSFNYAKSIMFKSELNPCIVAAVKSKKQLEEYLQCLENDKLDTYPYFKIIYQIAPLKTPKKQGHFA